ncbi:MAG TPA: hypothetical protein DCM08_00970 [Microscillaceae bacterium]|nr:hypothetical protein [Microscillaceae bacterium]
MKNNVLSSLFIVLLSIVIHWNASAQNLGKDDYKVKELKQTPDSLRKLWTSSGSVTFTFTNIGLQEWAGGGDNAISVGGIFNGNLKRETDRSIWESSILAALGIARVGGSDRLFKKTDDQLVLNSNYERRINKNWGVSAGLNLRTQMLSGYTFRIDSASRKEVIDREISTFFSPAFALATVGFVYRNKILTVTLSPIGGRFTFVTDPVLSRAGAFGVTPGQNVRSEVGYNLNIALNWDLMKNINFKSLFNLFGNYEKLYRGVVNWDTILTFKVNEIFNTTFTTQFIYDDAVKLTRPNGIQFIPTQFKYVLNIGVTLKF